MNTFFITFILRAIKHFLIAVSIVLLSNLFFDCSLESFALKPILFDCIIKTQTYLHRLPLPYPYPTPTPTISSMTMREYAKEV